MENTIANICILDVVRLVHGYFNFVFLIINMLSPFKFNDRAEPCP
jgi:hypothetical protein